MAKSSILKAIKQALFEQHIAQRSGLPVEAVRELGLATRARSSISRRTFLRGAAAATVAAAVPFGSRRASAAAMPRIAIVGAGISGLTAAMTLKDHGIPFTMYEASASRLGGRMLTEGSYTGPGCGACHPVAGSTDSIFLDNQVVNLHCYLIDTAHTTMQNLAKRFKLPLIDLLAAEPRGSTDTYKFFNRYYSSAQATADYKLILTALRKDLQAAGYPTTYSSSTPGGRALDSMSVYDWIETRVPGGHSSPFGMLLDVAYVVEYGADTVDQSALGLLYLLGYGKGTEFVVYGSSDERYTIQGGMERLPKAISAYVGASSIRQGCTLKALRKNADSSYTLSFDGSVSDVVADIVLLSIPFAVLRDLDYSQAGFDALKHKAIQELGRGRNGKMNLQFTSRYWNQAGPWGGISNGASMSDIGYQTSVDESRGQPGFSGILQCYTGGSAVLQFAIRHPYGNTTKNTTVASDARLFLSQIEKVYPGISAQWNGRASATMPHLNPRFGCSYPYWRVGQGHTIVGYEKVRQGNVFFSGDHTSVDWGGWMEGAAAEGIRAGEEIAALIIK